jgi:hypothetical protein
MAEKEQHKEFWINPTYLTDSIRDLIGTLCEIRNALILSTLATDENKERGIEAKIALDEMAVKIGLLKPISLTKSN